MARLSLFPSELNKLYFDRQGPVQQHLSRMAQDTAAGARRLVRRDTGQLAGSIEVRYDAADRAWVVGSNLAYAAAQHEGARPHIIRPRNAASLHFFWANQGGIETFVPRQGLPGGGSFVSGGVLFIGKGYVNHPGHTGTFYLLRALQDAVNRTR